MEIVILITILVASAAIIFLQINHSLLLIKIFEVVNTMQQDKNLEVEAKQKARGLLDITTEQPNYPLRLR